MTRDLPRQLAPTLFAAGNLAYGVAATLEPQRSPAFAHVVGPLRAWGIIFVVLGALIIATMNSVTGSTRIAVIAVMVWLAWASFAVEARINDPAHVTLKGVIFVTWVAVLHFLLSPYARHERE